MRMTLIGLGLIGAAFAVAPATAADYPVAPPAPQHDGNSYWLDYKTDISESKRELASDLRRAKTEQDRHEAWAEYRREIADARQDYRREMNERGYAVRGSVSVLDDN